MKIFTILFFVFFSFSASGQTRYIHVVVPLCDNKNQGIVPVPEKIGNGQDPANNLYWGCKYGIKSYFKNQPEWKLLKCIIDPTPQICERLVFTHLKTPAYLIADAYRGDKIKDAMTDFLNYASGEKNILISLGSISIPAGGNSGLICYAGHNGLMDFSLDSYPIKADTNRREVIISACSSKIYFTNYIKRTGAYPLLWTTGLMCPEAYTLDAAIDSWIKCDKPDKTAEKAALIYSQYQKCSIRSAKKLIVTGY